MPVRGWGKSKLRLSQPAGAWAELGNISCVRHFIFKSSIHPFNMRAGRRWEFSPGERRFVWQVSLENLKVHAEFWQDCPRPAPYSLDTKKRIPRKFQLPEKQARTHLYCQLPLQNGWMDDLKIKSNIWALSHSIVLLFICLCTELSILII